LAGSYFAGSENSRSSVKAATGDFSAQLGFGNPELVLLHLGPHSGSLRPAVETSFESAAVQQKIGAAYAKDAPNLRMPGVIADDHSDL
jgi:hypothetical protein